MSQARTAKLLGGTEHPAKASASTRVRRKGPERRNLCLGDAYREEPACRDQRGCCLSFMPSQLLP